MKPIDEIRRQNFASLVAQEGSQVAVAERLGKNKNQVYQWLLEPSVNGSRNIGHAAARKIETAYGKTEGWLDTDHKSVTKSHPLGTNLAKLTTAVQFTRGVAQMLRQRAIPFPAEREAAVIQELYEILITPESEENLATVLEYVSQHVGGEDVRQNEVRSSSKDDLAGPERDAVKA